MKKIITLVIAFFSATALFAQWNDGGHNDHFGNYNNSGNSVSSRDGYSNNNVYNYPVQSYDHRYDDQRRKEDMDRMNGNYDRRINDYRNDRSIGVYERNRGYERGRYERNSNLKSFAGGAVVGAVAGVLLGAVLSH
jgi:hypothetical protein